MRWVIRTISFAVLAAEVTFSSSSSTADSYYRQSGEAELQLLPMAIPQNGVLLIPGIAGTGLFVTLNQAALPACSASVMTTARARLWASLLQLRPPISHQMCWAAKVSLDFHLSRTDYERKLSTTAAGAGWMRWLYEFLQRVLRWWRSILPFAPAAPEDEPLYAPKPGVAVEVDSPNSTRGFEYLDYVQNVGIPLTKYFHDLICMLRKAGYVDGDTLLGYPFDWRYPLWQLDFRRLKGTIETFAERHPGQRVTLVSHSLGSAVTTYFLNEIVDAAWKKKHIEAFISIAGAFGGAHKAIRCLLSGYADASTIDFFGLVNVSLMSPLVFREAHRSFGSMYSMLPNLELFGRNTTAVEIIDDYSLYQPQPMVNITGEAYNFRELPHAMEIHPMEAETMETQLMETPPAAVLSPIAEFVSAWGCPLNRRFLWCLCSSARLPFTALLASSSQKLLSAGCKKETYNAGRRKHMGGAAHLNAKLSAIPRAKSFVITKMNYSNYSNSKKKKKNGGQSQKASQGFGLDKPEEAEFVVMARRLKQVNDDESRLEPLRSPYLQPGTFSLESWISLLPRDLQRKALQAQKKIFGTSTLLRDPGVRRPSSSSVPRNLGGA